MEEGMDENLRNLTEAERDAWRDSLVGGLLCFVEPLENDTIGWVDDEGHEHSYYEGYVAYGKMVAAEHSRLPPAPMPPRKGRRRGCKKDGELTEEEIREVRRNSLFGGLLCFVEL